MKCYFIVTVYADGKDRGAYEEYISEVKTIVERFGGKYLARTDNIEYLSEEWRPDRVIVIEFQSEEKLKACFSSEEYLNIKQKRESSVRSAAIIVKGND